VVKLPPMPKLPRKGGIRRKRKRKLGPGEHGDPVWWPTDDRRNPGGWKGQCYKCGAELPAVQLKPRSHGRWICSECENERRTDDD
jgi:hypothetical protein